MQVRQIPEKQSNFMGNERPDGPVLEKGCRIQDERHPCSCHLAVRSLESQDEFQNRSEDKTDGRVGS